MQKNFKENELRSALSFIHENLEAFELSHKDSMRSELFCEEALIRLMAHSDFNTTIDYFRVRVRKSFGSVLIDMSVPGPEFDFAESLELPDDEAISYGDSQEAIQNLLLRSFIGQASFRHSGNFNTVTFTAFRSSYSSLYKLVIALVLAVITGLSMRAFAPEELYMTINANFFSVVSSIFINGLKMCAVPVVFFSIISCFADMGNLRGIKKAGAALFTWFVIIQVLAVSAAFLLVFAFGTGKGAGLSITSGVSGFQGNFSLSFRDTIINLMPGNLIRPFLEGNMLQLITLAVLMGSAAGISGAKSVIRGSNELSAIFMRITTILIKIIPLVVFCSVSSMIITTGFNTIISLFNIFLTSLSGHTVMIIICCLSVKFFAGLSPSIMLKKFMNSIITAVSTCSSNAVIPDAMTSAKNMGISPKLYPFAIPLGISINKMSSCVYMTVMVLSVSNMYGLEISPAQVVMLLFSTIILSVATPAISGAGPATLSILFTQMGLPLDLIGPIIAVAAIEDMIRTPANCLGNIVPTLIAAKSADLLDIEEYNKL